MFSSKLQLSVTKYFPFAGLILWEAEMEERKETYREGGSFEAVIGNTSYEVVLSFKSEGMSLQDKTIRVVREEFGKKCA